MSKKRICKNCGDHIGDDSNSNEFCSGQCEIEYQLEHNRKWGVRGWVESKLVRDRKCDVQTYLS